MPTNILPDRRDPPLVVSPRRACNLLDCGFTKLYSLMNEGELDSFRDGKMRRITMESIRRYINRHVEQTEAA